MNFEEAKERAVRYIVTTLRTEHEVREKLKKLDVEENIIDEVISYLKNIDYINDETYVDAYLRQCIKIPKYSVFEIKMKLKQKGIDKDLIDKKLDKFNSKEYEMKIVEKLRNGKLKDKEKIKQDAYLYRRGFKISGIDIDE